MVDRAELRPRVEKALSGFLAGQRDRLSAIDEALVPVANALDSFVLRGGKRLRPAFGYWAYRGAGGPDSEQVITALAALELVHASALIHDDVIDASDTRRGDPSVHQQFAAVHRDAGWRGDPASFGDAAAILLGDLCLVWSDELLDGCGLDPYPLSRGRAVFDRMRSEISVGQYLDVIAQSSGIAQSGGEVPERRAIEQAIKVAHFKSAKYTVEGPLLFGAALAGAPAALVGVYSAYGLPLGEAFQLRDDVLGVFGDPALTGKPAGDDLREGKRTYLVAVAFAAAGPADRAALCAGLGRPDLDPSGVARLQEIITRTGALRRTEHRITELAETALDALADGAAHTGLESEASTALADLAAAATSRAG